MALTKPNTNQVERHPDARKHKYVSFAKSAIRIAAFAFLAYYEIQTAAVLLVIAELVGVVEELV
jgi:diketogulonate reductase-like aldo/keto reductase